MAARAGMTELIAELRGLCDAGTADYSITGVAVTFWSDDQLQDVLDGHRSDVRREPLLATPDTIGGGSVVTHDYYFRAENVEGTASGTAAWVVRDTTGAAVDADDYSVNLRAQTIRFTANTQGTVYVLTCRSYDIERAAAAVWEQKAGHAASRFDLKTDNHDMKRSQVVEHCLKMAAQFRRSAKAQVARRVRSDVNPAGWR